MKPNTPGGHPNSTKIGQPYICQRSKECFDLSIKGNLRAFQNHRKQAKIDVYFYRFPWSKRTTKILNFSNPSTFAHGTAD